MGRNTPHRGAAAFIDYLMSPARRDRLLQARPRSCRSADAAPIGDPALAGVEHFFDDGKIIGFIDHQIPPHPARLDLQQFMLDGDTEAFLHLADNEWAKVAARTSTQKGMTMSAPRPATGPGESGPPADTANRTFYWMVVPAVVIFFALHTIPVLTGMFFSLTNYAGYGNWNFVGLSNYINLFKDDRVLNSYGFTFLFAIVSTILVNVISLAIALGLNAKIKFQTAFRGVFFIPYVLAILIIGYVFNYLFANSLPVIGQALGIAGSPPRS